MKYVALLRGINVGGNNLIMDDLKETFKSNECTHVMTYIASGNVLFDTAVPRNQLERKLEMALTKRFDYNSTVIVRSIEDMHELMEDTPSEWKTNTDIRKYVAFLKDTITPQQVLDSITINIEVDTVSITDGALFLTTKLAGITKSGFKKLVGSKIFQNITIRNYNTTAKIYALMKK